MAYAKCPQCRGTNLAVIEVLAVSGQTDFGQHEVSDSQVFPSSPFYYEPEDTIRVEMQCGGCSHRWTSRRTVGTR